jgi:hypothetical protein
VDVSLWVMGLGIVALLLMQLRKKI